MLNEIIDEVDVISVSFKNNGFFVLNGTQDGDCVYLTFRDTLKSTYCVEGEGGCSVYLQFSGFDSPICIPKSKQKINNVQNEIEDFITNITNNNASVIESVLPDQILSKDKFNNVKLDIKYNNIGDPMIVI